VLDGKKKGCPFGLVGYVMLCYVMLCWNLIVGGVELMVGVMPRPPYYLDYHGA
jgi:hypothetical protein